MLLLFEENEDEVLNVVMSALNHLEEKTQLQVKTKLVFRGIEIDAIKRLVYRDGKEIKMTFTEFEILHLLASNPGGISLTDIANWFCMVKKSTMKRKWNTGAGMKFLYHKCRRRS